MMSIGYNPFDEDFSIEEFHEYRAMAYSLREENLRLKRKVDELTHRIESVTSHQKERRREVWNKAVKDTVKKYHDAVKKLFDDADCCGWIEDSETKYWHEDNDKIAREQFGVEVER